ncbi:MAG: asparagine--tRNA ligase [Oscillospiraceae bacterium]|nr:asparagine--tRNA ligase [Oscillospiraceae bacterium]
MIKTKIKDIYKCPESHAGANLTVGGWARFIRSGSAVGFIELNDGSFFKNLQIVFESKNIDNYSLVASQNVGASFVVSGRLVMTPNSKQKFEMNALKIEIEGTSAPEYPLQKKRHSPEFLREIAHLRPRANLYSAAFRIRSAAAFAIHSFFNERGFAYIHTPIITASDCEGAGDMFKVVMEGSDDCAREFFGKKAFLTVSGQLNLECFALAFGNVYSFGPTFRAETSSTQRHAAEFWMIEPEMAFADLADDMELARECLVYVTAYVLRNCGDELEFLNQFVEPALLMRLSNITESKFGHISYTKAIELLDKCGQKFEYPVKWGMDIQTEHERYLSEQVFDGPVFVTDYPADIKSFYMKRNEDGRTVAAMDLLVPGVGELIGGSQREENYDKLIEALQKNGMKEQDYWWYLELRKYGSAKHAGFGIGFERLVMYLTGISNIRDVCAFPRTYGNAEF